MMKEEAEKTLQQEPCKYAISKKAVLYKIKEVCFSREWSQFRSDYGSNGQRDFLINYIEQLPPVTPQPKIGHWIKEKSVHGWDGNSYQCSECGRSIHIDSEVEDLSDYPYCHCGSKMIDPQESEVHE